MSPKQKKIAAKAPPPNKITGADFAVLKKEKAKGRGMGLQDESIKPGKVQKAFLGKMIKGVGKSMGRIFGRKQSATATPGATVSQKASLPINIVEEYKKAKGLKVGGTMKANKGKSIDTKAFKKTLGVMPTIDKAFPRLKADPTKPISSVKPNVSNSYMKSIGVFPKVSGPLKKKKLPGRIGTALGIGAMMVPAAYAAAKQYKDYKSAKNRDKAKVKKYSLGGDILTQFKDIMTGSKDSKISKAKEGLKKQIAEGRAKMRDKAKVKKYSKGGGADTGTAGERRSRLLTAVQRAARRARTRREGKELGPIGGFRAIPSPKRTPRAGPMRPIPERLSKQDILFTTDKSFLEDMKPPRGPAPGKFKSGTMVKARGCKLGRSKPTKMY